MVKVAVDKVDDLYRVYDSVYNGNVLVLKDVKCVKLAQPIYNGWLSDDAKEAIRKKNTGVVALVEREIINQGSIPAKEYDSLIGAILEIKS